MTPSGMSMSIMGMETPDRLGVRRPGTEVPGRRHNSASDYRDALSFSTILLAAAPEELFC